MARPVTVGAGKRLSIYLPRKVYERMEAHKKITTRWGTTITYDNSSFIQQAIVHFCDRCDELAEYDAAMTKESERRIIHAEEV